MKVMTSQDYINYDIVDAKILELAKEESVTLPIIPAYTKDPDGEELYILIDGHHRLTAAKEMGITINYDIVEDERSHHSAIEDEDGEEIMLTWRYGDDWRYAENGVQVW